MLLYSGADPSLRDEVLTAVDVKPPKTFPKKSQIRAWVEDFTSGPVAAAGFAAMVVLASTDTGLRVRADDIGDHDSSPGLSSKPPDRADAAGYGAAQRPRPSQDAFHELGRSDPDALKAWVNSGTLSVAHLSFAAEALGEHGDNSVVPTLLDLLNHESPLVREGAVYGLEHHLDANVSERLVTLARTDTSPGVRSAATDVLGA